MNEDKIQTLLNALHNVDAINQHRIDAREDSQLAWLELMRLARLGAAVEAMPKGSSLHNPGTSVHHMGDAWTFEDQWERSYDGLTAMEALSMKKPMEA